MTIAEHRNLDQLAAAARTAAHPLEPLTADEVSLASAILKAGQGLTESARFVYVELAEPPKTTVLSWQPGDDWDRQAALLLRDHGARTTHEAVVSLSRAEVVSYRLVEGVQPPMMFEEFMACEDLVRSDPRWQEAVRRRGVEDPSLAMVDPWASGYTGPDDAADGHRLARPLTFIRSGPDDNG